MKWGKFLLGLAAGAAAGYLWHKSKEMKFLKPESVIENIKAKYRNKLEIIGSWIHIEPISEEHNGLEYKVYQCGITGVKDNEPYYFEFKVDADTGAILSHKQG